MRTLNFTPDMTQGLMQVLLAILNMGNLQFTPGTGSASATCTVAAEQSGTVDLLVDLLGVDKDGYNKCLIQKKLQMGKGECVYSLHCNHWSIHLI